MITRHIEQDNHFGLQFRVSFISAHIQYSVFYSISPVDKNNLKNL